MKNPSVPRFTVLLLCAVIAIMLLSSCAADPSNHPLTTSADRFINQTVGPEYEAYIKLGLLPPMTDEQVAALQAVLTPEMFMTADEKRVRLTNVEMFRIAVAQAKGGEGL